VEENVHRIFNFDDFTKTQKFSSTNSKLIRNQLIDVLKVLVNAMHSRRSPYYSWNMT